MGMEIIKRGPGLAKIGHLIDVVIYFSDKSSQLAKHEACKKAIIQRQQFVVSSIFRNRINFL
jgi:hypothetical protein